MPPLFSITTAARQHGVPTLLAIALAAPAATAAPAPTYNRDIRPILSDNCFACHGPDASNRQGDLRLDVREAAIAAGAIVPGAPGNSSLVERINATDPDTIMPPPRSHKRLDARQKETLGRWIAAGAEYQKHWAYEPPVKAAIPPGADAIDHLVAARLVLLGLVPAAEADRRTLIRRLSFDLLGLPPEPADVDAFVADTSPDAYARLVDRLLASPHYGERMAVAWLDVVRFADTIGYHSDNPRPIWPYRDWVIRAFNDNMPFDRFTIEQLAGDLIPEPTRDTKVASAFNRLLLTTEEGGAQAKDYEARMLTDRVRAVGSVWLGQTTGCAACHDHKFDPITMQDFYALGAFFADIDEPAIGGRGEGMLVLEPEQQARLDELDAAVAKAKAAFAAREPELAAAQRVWEADLPSAAEPAAGPDSADRQPTDKKAADKQAAIVAILGKQADTRSDAERKQVTAHFRDTVTTLFAAERAAVPQAEKARNDFVTTLPRCLVTKRVGPRRVRILPRGNWMDESGPVVTPAFPAYLPAPRIEGREPNRLDLARWLVSRDNPLTARVVMNRLWKQFFGTGLSRVLDDFGAQGETPANAAVLDWLACEFMDRGWDMKRMVRTIVMSSTYRRSATAPAAVVAADPANRELARQSPFRLDAEFVRDAALASSGLLVRSIGGPSAKPYQPDGYWENLNFPTRTYAADKGEQQYRRGLYTWWQRSFLHPGMLAFDAPSREECCAERTRSNIPQQALVLLNDPTYVEAARSFAARILRECDGGPPERLAWAWRQALQRPPRAEELETMLDLQRRHRAAYAADPKAADELLAIGATPVPAGLDTTDLAAWTHVARILLNLHETITRP
jgi:cytochrome c553